MKKIILILIFTVGLMSFTTSNDVKTNKDLQEATPLTEQVQNNSEDDSCRYRYCLYVGGVKIFCTVWQEC